MNICNVNKKILITTLVITSIITLIGVPKLFINKKEEKLPEVKLKEIEKDKTFAIMVPDINGNGYIPYEGDKWPTEADEYYYSHSECVDNKGNKIENVMEYNQEENTALLDTSETTYCTLYFDKYPYMYVPIHSVVFDSKGNTAPVPEYMSAKVKQVEFVNYIKNNLNPNEKNVQWWDISDTSQGTPKGSVIAWIEPIDNNYDTLYIGSKTIIRAINLYRAFCSAEFEEGIANTNLEKICFNDILDLSKTIVLNEMFAYQSNLTKIEGMENWDVSKVESTSFMFQGCQKLYDLSFLSNWNIINLKFIEGMFVGCESLKDFSPISNWSISPERVHDIFSGCVNLTKIDLKKWNFSKTTSLESMFYNCTSLKEIIGINDWNVSKVENLSLMFYHCEKLENINLSNWTTTNLKDISHMFLRCENLNSITGLEKWNVSCLSSAQGLFADCFNLESINLCGWNTINLVIINFMFSNCKKIKLIDMSNATFMQVKEYDTLFYMVPESATIIVKDEDQRNWLQTYPTFPGTIKLPSEV